MRTLAKLAVALVLAMTVSACGDFLDINESPNAATSPPVENILPSAMVAYAQNQASEVGWIHAYHAQTWADQGAFVASARYRIGGFARGNSWSTYYLDGGDLKTVQDVAAENDDLYASAQARLMRQYFFLETTSIYEDIPYTETARIESITNPKFDSQETVLIGIIAHADTALSQLAAEDGGNAITTGDLIYGGNTQNWVRFANALKLKAATMLAGGNRGAVIESVMGDQPNERTVTTEIERLVALDDSETMRTNASNANIEYEGGTLESSNPLWQLHARFNSGFIDPFDSGNVDNTTGFYAAGEALVDLMNDLDDPRRKVYFYRNDAGDDDYENGQAFVGRPPADFGGIDSDGDGDTDGPSGPSSNIIRQDKPVRVFSAAEILFYEAEALLQSDPSRAEAKFEAAVRASLDYFDSIVTSSEDDITESEKDAYIASLPDLNDGSLSGAEKIEAIHQQHYIELFERGTDVWVQQRRTGIPQLGLPQGAALPGIISRWEYPPNVQVNNPNTPQSKPGAQDMFFEGG